MPILGVIASGISGNLYSASYESIATVTVGAGGASSVFLSGIPQTYTHLQVRILTRSTFSANEWPIFVQPNIDGANVYSYHDLNGNGSTATSSGTASTSIMQLGDTSAANGTANAFGMFIIDFFDYTNTNKLKATRTFYGYDLNGSGKAGMRSGLYQSTNAITSLGFGTGSNFAQHSSFALYGIKGVA